MPLHNTLDPIAVGTDVGKPVLAGVGFLWCGDREATVARSAATAGSLLRSGGPRSAAGGSARCLG